MRLWKYLNLPKTALAMDSRTETKRSPQAAAAMCRDDSAHETRCFTESEVLSHYLKFRR